LDEELLRVMETPLYEMRLFCSVVSVCNYDLRVVLDGTPLLCCRVDGVLTVEEERIPEVRVEILCSDIATGRVWSSLSVSYDFLLVFVDTLLNGDCLTLRCAGFEAIVGFYFVLVAELG
jgi:hypothetical protein